MSSQTDPSDYLDALYAKCTDGQLVFVAPCRQAVSAVFNVDRLDLAAKHIDREPLNLFLKINVMDHTRTKARNPNGIGEESEVKAVVSIHLDIDAGKNDKYLTRELMLDAIAKMPLEPSAIIESNGSDGGFHAYWILDDPHYIIDDDDRQRIKRLSTRWLAELRAHASPGLIDGTANLDRVLRPVGSLRKSQNRVRPLIWEPGKRYRLDDFALPDIEVPTLYQTPISVDVDNEHKLSRASAYLARMDPAIAGQNGHVSLLRAACAIHIGFDLDEETAHRLLAAEYNARCQPAWSEQDIRRKLIESRKTDKTQGYLLMDGNSISGSSHHDVVALVCQEKKLPIAAFMQFEPTIEKRGRSRTDVARIPVYSESGEPHSYFDIAPGNDGWFARGKGMSGMFFPGRLPQPGETWYLVENYFNAVALVGMELNAAGMPVSCLPEKYAHLFAGCHVIFIPDVSGAGVSSAQVSGSRLNGIAESIKVARLPGEPIDQAGDDVRDILAKDGGEQLVRQAIESAQPWRPREGEQKPKDGRPEVLVTLAYGEVADEVTKHLGQLGWSSTWVSEEKRESLKIYQRGGSLVHVVIEDNDQQLQGVSIPAGTARIRPLPTGQLPLRISDSCQLVVERVVDEQVECVPVPPHKWLVDGIATRGDWGRHVRRLEGIVTAPTIRPDGSILQSAGYDEKTGLLLILSCKFPLVPERPSPQDSKQAAELLLDVVKDFPFVDDADRSAWIALVLSQLGRAAITGCVPLFALTATTRGSGKSLLADAANIIAFGRCAPRKTFSKDDAEQRKSITATALEALPSVLLDNVDCLLGGSSLDAALTATTWTDRILGASKTTGELPLRTVWSATGNNLRFGSDLARRVLPVRLAPQIENPEERTDFEHFNLLEWVHDTRPQLVIAALTMLRAYVVDGRPPQPSGSWGSFEAWSDLVRGAIVWTGLTDPLGTRQTAKADDTSGAIVRGLIGGLLEIDSEDRGLTVREIVAALNSAEENKFTAMREVVTECATTRGNVDGKRLTYVFRKYKGRVANGWQITGESSHGGVMRWRCVKVLGDHGDYGDHAPGYSVWPNRVSHTDQTCDTRNSNGDWLEVSSLSSPSSPPAALDATTGGDDVLFI